MYYTIEGKRLLVVFYIAGLVLGTILLNMLVRMQVLRTSDFLDFTEYMKTLKSLDTETFFSYVFLVRLRQLFLFFLCLFLFSPYMVFCIGDFLMSSMLGFFISVMVLKFGWTGMLKGVLFLFPHYLLYLGLFFIVYIYLFQKRGLSSIHFSDHGSQHLRGQRKKLLEHRFVVVIFILVFFLGGCYLEAYLSPRLLSFVFR